MASQMSVIVRHEEMHAFQHSAGGDSSVSEDAFYNRSSQRFAFRVADTFFRRNRGHLATS